MEYKRIFTFWEPHTDMPAYIKLCMQTWKIFLPDYEIILLDYSNIDEWLGENCYDKSLYKNFSLPKQADAIRCAVLKKYGGIWIDADTIITSDSIKNVLQINSEFVLIDKHICFILAQKNARVLLKWEEGIKRNIMSYELCHKSKIIRFIVSIFAKSYLKRMERWDFLGNSILKRSLKTQDKQIFYSLDKLKLKALPELNWADDNNIKLSVDELYRNFYFENDFSSYALQDGGGIICLHNSWTPEKYMHMSENEFLGQNITISTIFRGIGIEPCLTAL